MAPHKDYDASSTGSYTPPLTTTSSNNFLPHSIYSQPSENTSIDSMDSPNRQVKGGVIVPIMTPFLANGDIDQATLADHVRHLAEAGVAGITTQGSNGEAVHLTHEERNLVTSVARQALTDAGFLDMPIIVGCGAQSTREAISLCRQAKESGGDAALILPPAYYASLFHPDSATIIEFFTTVADASPIPIIIYNFPGAVNGLDLSSDVIIELSKHKNIVGVKLTCCNAGKLIRVVEGTESKASKASGTGITEPDFLVLGGSADFTMATLDGDGHGILAGLANIAPRACIKLISLYKEEKFREAKALQKIIAKADWQMIKTGVVGTKSVLNSYYGYGGFARSPLPRSSKEMSLKLWKDFEDLMVVEKALKKEQGLMKGGANGSTLDH